MGPLIVLSIVFGLAIGFAAPSGNSSAQSKWGDEANGPTLQRGLNLSHWFAQVRTPQGFIREHLITHTTAADLALIRRLGFDHVRLSIDPATISAPGNVDIVQLDRLHELERAIQMIIDSGLVAVIDIHPTSDFKMALERDNDRVARFADFWHDLAGRFAALPVERVVLEILNEPQFQDRYRWSGVQAKLLASIRQATPRHTVIVSGHGWASSEELLSLESLGDAKVIYNFHFYLPHIFTHQGATWGRALWQQLAAVPYPSSPDNVAPVAGGLTDDVSKLLVTRYGYEQWNQARVRAEIQQVAHWATQR